jgi:hypothetical protein
MEFGLEFGYDSIYLLDGSVLLFRRYPRWPGHHLRRLRRAVECR